MTLLATAAEALGLAYRAEDTAPAPEPAILPPAREAAGVVGTREAMTLDSVFRAFFVLQTATEQLSLDQWTGGTKVDTPHRLVTKPDPDRHLADHMAETTTCLAARGNAFWRIYRWRDDEPIALRLLDPLAVVPWTNRHGQRRFTYEGKDYTPKDMAHLRLVKLAGHGNELGLGPIQAAQRGLRGQLDQVGYADGWFTQAGVPNGVLSTDQHLTDDEAKAYKTRWMATQRAHEPAVMGKGLAYRPLQLKPAEVQWLETRKFGVTGVARLFGMPSRYLLAAVDGTSDTYSNAEQEDIAFVRYTLMRYLREYETTLDQLLPRTTTVRANVDALLRTDTLTRYKAHEIGIRAGFLLPEEVRAIEGLRADVKLPDPKPAPAAIEPADTDQESNA